jgi:apolipoprotein N-acyltransferase
MSIPIVITFFATILADSPTDQTASGLGAMMAAFTGVWLIVTLVAIVIGIIAYWKIAEKAGYAGALSLLMLVPLVNLVIFLIFAFTEWPIQAQLRAARGGR